MLKKNWLGSTVRNVLFSLFILYLSGTLFGGISLGWIAPTLTSPPVTGHETANAEAIAKAASEKFTDASVTTSDGMTFKRVVSAAVDAKQ